MENLVAAIDLHTKRVAEILGKGDRLVCAAAKVAIELRIVQVQKQTGFPHLAEREAISLVPRILLIGGCSALSQAGEQADTFEQGEPHIAAPTLKQIQIEQTGSQQTRIKGRQRFEVVVIYAKSKEFHWLEVQRRKALCSLRGVATAIHQRRRAGSIGLERIVERNVLLPRPGVFEEGKLPRHFPLDARQCHADRTVQTQMVEAAIFNVYQSSGNMLVGVITPGGRVGSGAAKESHGNLLGDLPAEIAAVNRAQARRPGNEQSTHSQGHRRIGVLVSKTDAIGAVD